MATEVISAWDIYLVMQLDSIGGFLAFAGFATGVVAAILFIVWAAFSHANPGLWHSPELKLEEEQKLQKAPSVKKAATRSAMLCALFAAASAFVPSTKTAAAMIVLPAIANNEAIQAEAADLYKLAKQALTDAVKSDDPQPERKP